MTKSNHKHLVLQPQTLNSVHPNGAPLANRAKTIDETTTPAVPTPRVLTNNVTPPTVRSKFLNLKSNIITLVFLVYTLTTLPHTLAQQTLPLWDESLPVPKSAELLPLEGVEFHLIKPRVPEQDGYNWLHGVALAWHQDQLYTSFGHNAGKENTASELANAQVSPDGGKTWGPLTLIDDGQEQNLAVSHGVFLSHQSKLWAFQGSFYNRMEDIHTRGYVLDETTGNWKKLGVLIEGGFWPMQEPLPMDDGNWIMAGLAVVKNGSTDQPAAVAISDGNDFTKWDLIVIPRPKNRRMWGESTVLVVGPNITNISRYREKALALISTSQDHGRTWTLMAESNLPMTTSKPYAGTLSTGQSYLVCTTTADAGSARAPLTIAIAEPGEPAFSRIYRVRNAIHQGKVESHPEGRLSYPYAIEHQGKLYIGYSNNGGRGSNKNSAELAIIPIKSLQPE